MAFATIFYNDGTGSDTAASGSNVPTTALTDASTSETVSGTAAATTITFSDTVDLTGVADDGTDLIWVDGNSGERHLFRITAFTGGVSTCTDVTVVEAIGATNITTSAWAIGGIRASLQNDGSQEDWKDFNGWDVEFADGDVQVVSEITSIVAALQADGETVWRTASGFTTKAKIWRGTGVGGVLFTIGPATDTRLTFQDLELQSDSGTGRLFVQSASSACMLKFIRCYMHHVVGGGNDVLHLLSDSQMTEVIDCDIQGGCVGILRATSANGYTRIIRTRFRDCDEEGIFMDIRARAHVLILDCIVDTCGASVDPGIHIGIDSGSNRSSITIDRTAVYNSGSHGINVAHNTAGEYIALIENCILDSNGGYGISGSNAECVVTVKLNTNAYRNNTSGQTNNVTNTNAITMTAIPWTDAANEDFSLVGTEVDNDAIEITN